LPSVALFALVCQSKLLVRLALGTPARGAKVFYAFLVALQLRDFPDHQYWEEGRKSPIFSLKAGCTTLYDLKRGPAFLIDKSFHSVHFYFPRKFLEAIADDASAGG
jgi:hypothetical protein